MPVSQKTITPLLRVACDRCGNVYRGDTMHVFESTKGVAVGVYCSSCCPRCDHPSHSWDDSAPDREWYWHDLHDMALRRGFYNLFSLVPMT